MSNPVHELGFHVATPVTGSFAAANGTSSGSVPTGWAHSYVVTYVTVYGETLPSGAVSRTTATGSVALSNIPVSPSDYVLSKNIYRTQSNGGTTYYVIANVANSVTTYTDTAAEQTASAQLPGVATCDPILQIQGNLALTAPLLAQVATGLTATGTNQATALPITAAYNVVSSVPAGTGVVLPLLKSTTVGMQIMITNTDAAQALAVYPGGSNQIAGPGNTAAGASTSIAAGATVAQTITLTAVSSSLWLRSA